MTYWKFAAVFDGGLDGIAALYVVRGALVAKVNNACINPRTRVLDMNGSATAAVFAVHRPLATFWHPEQDGGHNAGMLGVSPKLPGKGALGSHCPKMHATKATWAWD
jgi:hypothetical protein